MACVLGRDAPGKLAAAASQPQNVEQDTHARNLAYALQQKLAFSPLVDPASPRNEAPDQDEADSISFAGGSRRTTLSSHADSSKETAPTRRSTAHSITLLPPPAPMQDITFQATEPKDAWSRIPELQRARDSLARLVLTRIHEFQLLTGWPLQGKRRTPAQLAHLLDQAEEEGSEGAAWQALGMYASPFLELPSLPDLTRGDLWGPLDVLLALSGHLEAGTDNSSQTPSLFALNPTPAAPTGSPASFPISDSQPTPLPNVAVPPATDPATTRQCPRASTKLGASPLLYPSLLNNQGGTTASSYGSAGSLPKSMLSVAWLPALRGVQAVGSDWLRAFLADLRPQQRHVGVDDRLHPWFREVKVQAARSLVAEGSIPLCRGFAKYGVPHGCRAGIWEVAMGLAPGPVEQAETVEFESLIHEACCQPLLADLWAHTDSLSVRDSEQYFLFEDILRAVHLAFLRDTRVASRCSVKPHPCVVVHSKTAAGGVVNSQVPEPSTMSVPARPDPTFPPCGALPPRGTLMLAGPLCFMYEDPAAVYRMHRALYCRYWCKLHSLAGVGPPSPALPVLVRTFEELMQELDPEVVSHLHKLGVPCASLALPWMTRAFVGYLPVEEVLLLWDRVIGLDSLLPVTLLAVAVMCFRRQVLLSCGSAKEVVESMADLSQLQTVPLLQAVLFQG